LDSYTTSYLFAQGSLIALMMEAAHTSEKSVDIYLTTWQYIPDSELHARHHENLKSHILKKLISVIIYRCSKISCKIQSSVTAYVQILKMCSIHKNAPPEIKPKQSSVEFFGP
jgi:hypothetical protein